MKKLLPYLSLVLLGCLAPATVAAQGVLLNAKVEFNHVSYDSAFSDATESYDSDLLIYFYREDSHRHQEILSQVLNEETLSQFINENFARIAVDMTIPEGQEVLALFRPDVPDWPFVVVQYTDEPFHIEMHGWGINNEEDLAGWINSLHSLKNKEHPLYLKQKG